MSEQELYEIARKRINKRNRLWMIWGADLMLWLAYIGVFAGFKDVIPRGIGTTIVVIWMGALVLHGIYTSMAQDRDQAIEGEVERLRQAIYEEKPKRLELSEDGELVEFEDEPKRKVEYK